MGMINTVFENDIFVFKLYYCFDDVSTKITVPSAGLLDGVSTIDILSVFIWMHLFCCIVFACKKKVFTTLFTSFENVYNTTDNNYILHHSLMEIEDL